MKKHLYLLLPILCFCQCSAPVLTFNETTVPLAQNQNEIKLVGVYAERKDQRITNAGVHLNHSFGEKFELRGGYIRAASNKNLEAYTADNQLSLSMGKNYDAFYLSPSFVQVEKKTRFSNPLQLYVSPNNVGFSIINPCFYFNVMESLNTRFRLDGGLRAASPPTPLVISLPTILGFNFVASIFLDNQRTFLFTPEVGILTGYGDNRGSGGYASFGFAFRPKNQIQSAMPIPDIGEDVPMEVVSKEKREKKHSKKHKPTEDNEETKDK